MRGGGESKGKAAPCIFRTRKRRASHATQFHRSTRQVSPLSKLSLVLQALQPQKKDDLAITPPKQLTPATPISYPAICPTNPPVRHIANLARPEMVAATRVSILISWTKRPIGRVVRLATTADTLTHIIPWNLLSSISRQRARWSANSGTSFQPNSQQSSE